MIIRVDKFFLQALQRNGYDLSYEKLISISQEASCARQKALDKHNEELIKKLILKEL